MSNDPRRKSSLFDRIVMGSSFGVGMLINVAVALSLFFGVWWYLYVQAGFLVGGLLGWLPAGLCALVAYIIGIPLAPLVGLLAVIGLGYIVYKSLG